MRNSLKHPDIVQQRYMDDIDDIKRTLNLSNHLMLKRIKERAEAQKV